VDLDAAIEKAAEHLNAPAEVEPAPDPVVEAAAEAEAAPAGETPAQKAQRERDEKGRFAPKAEKTIEKPAAAARDGTASPAKPAGQGTPAAAPPSAAAGQPAPEASAAVKPPQSWTPAAREAFAKAPPEVQAEVVKREREIARTLQDTAHARQTAEQVQRTLAPYETIARANGMDAMSYAGSVLQTAAALHLGTPQQKAQAFAALIQQFQPDLEAINSFLQGQAPRGQPQQAPQPQVDYRAEMRRVMLEERARQEAEAFLANQPEFLDDVKDDMLLIRERAVAAGRNMTWPEAYDRACKLNENVSRVLDQRKAAEQLRTPQPVTEAARRAASSVRSRPAAAPAAQPKGLDGALAAAREKLGM
jgi:hypothetical protein